MAFLIVLLVILCIATITWKVLRSIFVTPILTRMTTTENMASSMLGIASPNFKACTYAEYFKEFSEIYRQIYLLYEITMIAFWKQNNALLDFLMSKSEKARCADFISTAYSYQEKYFEHNQRAICASYYM